MRDRILVIKHGGFGDLVQAFDAFEAIRRTHPEACITLMTAPPFAAIAGAMPWFDAVWPDARPSMALVHRWLALRARFLRENFTRVYDLQCSPRTAWYLRMLPTRRRPAWAGDAPGASHPVPGGVRAAADGHGLALARAAAGGALLPPGVHAETGWLDADLSRFALPARYALLVPGCSPHLPHKRWHGYGKLARFLAARGLPCVLAGTAADRAAIAALLTAAPAAIDLSGKTSLLELGAIARRAACAIGNDTGTTFLAAALGTPTLMLMSRHTDPRFSAPRTPGGGPGARWLKRETLDDLGIQDVLDHFPLPLDQLVINR